MVLVGEGDDDLIADVVPSADDAVGREREHLDATVNALCVGNGGPLNPGAVAQCQLLDARQERGGVRRDHVPLEAVLVREGPDVVAQLLWHFVPLSGPADQNGGHRVHVVVLGAGVDDGVEGSDDLVLDCLSPCRVDGHGDVTSFVCVCLQVAR